MKKNIFLKRFLGICLTTSLISTSNLFFVMASGEEILLVDSTNTNVYVDNEVRVYDYNGTQVQPSRDEEVPLDLDTIIFSFPDVSELPELNENNTSNVQIKAGANLVDPPIDDTLPSSVVTTDGNMLYIDVSEYTFLPCRSYNVYFDFFDEGTGETYGIYAHFITEGVLNPYIVSTEPDFASGYVDPYLGDIVVNFDQPMYTSYSNVQFVSDSGDNNYIFSHGKWSNDNKTCTFDTHGLSLTPNTEYQVIIEALDETMREPVYEVYSFVTGPEGEVVEVK